jgi:hypothetical protein
LGIVRPFLPTFSNWLTGQCKTGAMHCVLIIQRILGIIGILEVHVTLKNLGNAWALRNSGQLVYTGAMHCFAVGFAAQEEKYDG